MNNNDSPMDHPLATPFWEAIRQAMYGKGERHGGAAVDFLTQPWHSLAQTHGIGFLTGQAVKKIEEAMRDKKKDSVAFERELLGGLVYIGMAIIYHREQQSAAKPMPFDFAEEARREDEKMGRQVGAGKAPVPEDRR